MADALQATIAAAPDQWYNFKPIWPATPEESAELERRAMAALSGTGPAVGPPEEAPPPADIVQLTEAPPLESIEPAAADRYSQASPAADARTPFRPEAEPS
jgi:hypothetical protein